LCQEKSAIAGSPDLLELGIFIESYTHVFLHVVQNAYSLEKAGIYISLFQLSFFPDEVSPNKLQFTGKMSMPFLHLLPVKY